MEPLPPPVVTTSRRDTDTRRLRLGAFNQKPRLAASPLVGIRQRPDTPGTTDAPGSPRTRPLAVADGSGSPVATDPWLRLGLGTREPSSPTLDNTRSRIRSSPDDASVLTTAERFSSTGDYRNRRQHHMPGAGTVWRAPAHYGGAPAPYRGRLEHGHWTPSRPACQAPSPFSVEGVSGNGLRHP